MDNKDYTTVLTTSQTPQAVFDAIKNIPGWWSANFEGRSAQINDVFTVRFGETFITLKVVDLDPNEKISWQVIDCYKHWLKNKTEWMGTKINWEISSNGGTTQINFTHVGLVPGMECYDGCENAWGQYLHGSFFKLLTEGKGKKG